MSWQDAPEVVAPPAQPAWMSAPLVGPDMAAGNKTFARVLGDAFTQAVNKVKPAAETYVQLEVAPIEAALNAGTGMLFGFPARVGASIGGLAAKHALGMDVDPAAIADTMQQIFTYQPKTELGKKVSGNVNDLLGMYGLPEIAGHKATDVASQAGASTNTAAVIGAVTEQTIGLLPWILGGELMRKMGGQTVTAEDIKNTAKVVAGPEAPPATVTAVETSLHSTYEKTGIGPFTVAEAATKDPAIKADLLDPKVEVPKALEAYVEKPAEPDAPKPGDGEPLLDVSGLTADEKAADIVAERGGRAAAAEIAPAEPRQPMVSEETKPGPGGVNEPIAITVYDKTGMPVELTREFGGKYRFSVDGEDAGSIVYTNRPDGSFNVTGVEVKPELRRRGIASAVYDVLERRVIGQAFERAGGQSEAGSAFRDARDGRSPAEAPPIATPAQAAYDAAKAKLDALGPEPPKPSSDAKFFGTAGREATTDKYPEQVAQHDAEVKAYNAWRRKYTQLKKEEVAASNELFAEKQAAAKKPEPIGPSSTKGPEVQAMVDIRKRQSILQSLLECMA